jgi:hypothetical protein
MEDVRNPKTAPWLSTYLQTVWTAIRLLDRYSREAEISHLLA